jgi:hypothetical protein
VRGRPLRLISSSIQNVLSSVKTGVGGNSTAGSVDAMENDWEKLDAKEEGDPNMYISPTCDVELVMLAPSVFCRSLAMGVIN